MLAALTIACAVSCLALVLAEWRAHATVRVVTKLVASTAFVLLGLEVFQIGDDPARAAFGTWIFVGLVFGALGDAALLGRGKRWFLAGLVAFLLGHLAYVVAAIMIEAPARWVALGGGIIVVPVAAGATALVLLWPRLGAMKLPVILYVITIVTMVVAAIAIAHGPGLPTPQRLRFVAGAALFFVSDLAVARDRFVARAFVNKLWGLPAYYAGQLLIVWSVIGL